MNVKEVAKAIDSISSEAEKKRNKVKNKIRNIYKHNNPSKLKEVDTLMKKYRGKEEQLLEAIKQKYATSHQTSASSDKPWEFVLKNYEKNNRVQTNWNIDESIGNSKVQQMLNEMAESIDGKVDLAVNKDGKRKLVVRQKSGADYVSRDVVMLTVERMRDTIHKRYEIGMRNDSCSHLITNEHHRRKEEKRVDQLNKKKRDRKKKF